MHRQANAARRVERLDVPRAPVRHRLLDLRLAHQDLHLGAQFAPDQRDQVEGRLAGRNVEQRLASPWMWRISNLPLIRMLVGMK
jgi:hypothetical protein